MSTGNSVSGQIHTVADVVSKGLCCFCGACQGVCPSRAISLEWNGSFPVPIIEHEKCTNCGLCIEVCPGHEVDFDQLNTEFFGQESVDPILGCYLGFCVGAVKDPAARIRRTSGGLAKEIAIWGLEIGRWQAVIVSRAYPGNFRRTQTYLATSEEEVRSAASSLYCPVPACSSWEVIRDFSGKVCFIGLPCHIHALRKAQQQLPWLKEKITFTVGLFCSGTPGLWATEAFLSYHHINPDKVESFEYRGKGWPGDICVKIKDQPEPTCFQRMKAKRLKDRFRMAAAFVRRSAFVHQRCLVCPDHAAEFGDVSLGDAWHLGYNTEKLGLNIAVIRSRQGQDLLDEMCQSNRIFLDKISRDEMIKSQQACLASKKKLAPMFNLLRKHHVPLPVFTGQTNLPTSRCDNWIAWLEWNQTKLAGHRRLWWILLVIAPIMAILRRISRTSIADLKNAGLYLRQH
jgi:coenzyme F420 hydrogenase subunit beta